MMVDERWDGEQEADDSDNNHAKDEVVGFVYESELDAVLEQNFSDEASLESLKANSDHKSCCLAFKTVVYAHIHKPEFI